MTIWQTLLAVIVGGLIAPVGSVIVGGWDRRQHRRSLATALRGEIATILAIAERRRYVEFFAGFLEAWKSGERLEVLPGIYGLDPKEADPVVAVNLERIGELEPALAEDVVRFYATLQGIRQDIAAISRGDVETLQDRISLLEDDLALWRETDTLGKSLLNRLAKKPTLRGLFKRSSP